MNKNLAFGSERPDYQISGLGYQIWRGIVQTLSSGAAMFKGGQHSQLGGELLFNDGRVTWCHRMTNTRSHTEVSVLKKLLDMT